LRPGQFKRGFRAARRADQDYQHQAQMVRRFPQQACKLRNFQRPAQRLAVIDLDAWDVRRARDFSAAPGALQRGFADAEDSWM